MHDRTAHEALGPDAWGWAFKQQLIPREELIEEMFSKWYSSGRDRMLGEHLGMLILDIAAAWVDRHGDYYERKRQTGSGQPLPTTHPTD